MSGEAGWPAGTGRLILPETDSTNAEAARRAGSLVAPVWIMARRQTAARGRRGRPWASPEGNLAATLVLAEADPARAGLRSFVAALALAEALDAAAPGAAVALKWPNDVLLNGGKVAGILLESLPAGRGVAIGIGVNLAVAPDQATLEAGALRPVSVAGETGRAVAPEDFLDLLAGAFAGWEGRFGRFGFAPVRSAWLARAARLGERIAVRTGSTALAGRFADLAGDGALVLETPEGRQRIHAADVFF
ncbi:MAG: biotin--[acetyl-CoA-carboxylase] ligase [Rhodobacteraceae bacterium]|nr:biotin--[acetyl-CoA-carboxylase] ligase [Paracoccaceae bacterium]